MKRPNLFIIGAPKCGTTSLSRWMGQHPEIYFCPKKEPHYFNTDGMQTVKTLDEYERLFESATDTHRVVAEGSTHYLYSSVAVPHILKYNPDAKFIVCLRNPVEMAPSLHSERLSWGRETVKSFEKAWDMQRNPQSEWRNILEFLGLSDCEDINFEKANTSKRTHSPRLATATRSLGKVKRQLGINRSFGVLSWVRERNVTQAQRAVLSTSMRRRLIEYFEEDVGRLQALTNRDLSHWLV